MMLHIKRDVIGACWLFDYVIQCKVQCSENSICFTMKKERRIKKSDEVPNMFRKYCE